MKFRLSSKFGAMEEIRNGHAHTGIDLAMPEGTELRSIADGVVEKVFDGSGAIGKGVKIEFSDGTDAIYGHMSDVTVKVGEKVSYGQQIGISGHTGNVYPTGEAGAHLHFALKNKDGAFIDPSPIAEELAEISGDISSPNIFVSAYDKLTNFFSDPTASFRDAVRDQTTEFLYGFFGGIADFMYQTSTAVTLYGGAILILAIAVGYKDGKKWLGLLMLGNVLIKFFLGGA